MAHSDEYSLIPPEPSSASLLPPTEQKVKFSIKEFFIKCDQIRREMQIWSHLLKRS